MQIESATAGRYPAHLAAKLGGLAVGAVAGVVAACAGYIAVSSARDAQVLAVGGGAAPRIRRGAVIDHVAGARQIRNQELPPSTAAPGAWTRRGYRVTPASR